MYRSYGSDGIHIQKKTGTISIIKKVAVPVMGAAILTSFQPTKKVIDERDLTTAEKCKCKEYKGRKRKGWKMDFLDRMMGSFSTAGQDVAKKARNATENVKLNNQIKINERMIRKLIYQVGLLCYQNCGKESEEYIDLFLEINRLKEENRQIENEIIAMTAEKVCPQCGFRNEMGVRFCVNCGMNLQNINPPSEADMAAGKRCRRCGTDNDQEALFCVECGTKFPALDEEEIE